MSKNNKKYFFQTPTPRQIMNFTSITNVEPKLDEIIKHIIKNNNEESIRITGNLINTTPALYKKYSETLIIEQKTVENGSPLLPFELRKIAIQEWLDNKLIENENRLKEKKTVEEIIPFSSFAYRKPNGHITKKIFPVHILLATKLYSYSPWSIDNSPRINVKAYDLREDKFKDVKDRLPQNGASIVVRVPSRTKSKPNYEIAFKHIPLINNKHKFDLAYNIESTHFCKEKQYLGIKQPNITSSDIDCWLDTHDIAGLFGIIDYYSNPQAYGSSEKPNIIPLQMNVTGIPTKDYAKNLDTLLHNVIILPEFETRERKLNLAEMNYILSGILAFTGHDLNLFAKPSKANNEKLREYKWTSMNKYIQSTNKLI